MISRAAILSVLLVSVWGAGSALAEQCPVSTTGTFPNISVVATCSDPQVGPQGAQGLQGDKGDKGDKGDPGKDAADAHAGIALSLAMAAPTWLGDGENFAITGNVGYFETETAFAATGIMRIEGGLSINAGIGFAPDNNQMGGRAGLRFGW